MSIAIVVPVHNAEPYLERALNSIAEQERTPQEVIVVDDGSTDRSVEIARSHRVVTDLLESSWRNGAGTRNVGIEAASSKWIAFLDADDYWRSDHLEKSVALLEGGQDDAVHGHRAVIEAGGCVRQEPVPWPPAEPAAFPKSGLSIDTFLEWFYGKMIFNTSSLVMRRTLLVERGMFDPACIRRHDMEMWIRVLAGRTWSYNPAATMVYSKENAGSISRLNVFSSNLWHLKMLLTSKKFTDASVLDKLITRGARRAMNAAFTDGSAEDLAEAWEEAMPYVRSRRLRMLYHVARRTGPVFSTLNRSRRRWMMRHLAS